MIARPATGTRVETSAFSNKMKYFKQLGAVLLAALMVLPPAPLIAGTRKGDKLRNQARVEEVKGNLDRAFEMTSQAVAEDPGDPAYLLQLHRLRFELGVQHISKARKLRDAGKLTEAMAEFQKAYDVDPASDIAIQEVRRTQEMIDREKNGGNKSTGVTGASGGTSSQDTSSLTPAAYARKEQQERTDALSPVPILRPLNPELIDLKITNRPRTLFETVAKIAGINVIFDPDYNSQQLINQPVQIDLSHTTVQAALDQISLITKSFWKPIDSNTIFVAIDNRNNRTQFTEQVVKVFYLSNPTTPQEIQEILTELRTVLDIQKVFNYTSQNALIVRCDADTMALAEKVIADIDKPHNEVIIDVMILQVSSTYSRQIGAGLVNGINSAATFAPRASITTPASTAATSTATTSTTTTANTTTAATTTSNTTTPGASIPISQLGHISSADYSISNLPGATFEAMLSDSTTRVLQSPQIRGSQGYKSTINIGEKIPIATGSFQSAVGAVGALPAANTQFSFQQVGVTLEITPQVHDNNEVSMLLDLDVSQVIDRINVGGVSEPEIADNKITANIRLREGEVNLIGGIIQDTTTKAISGLPGLAHIPLLGRLFSNEDNEKSKSELVIALIPHIVRGPDISASNLKGVAAGSSTQIKVSYDVAKLGGGDGAVLAEAPIPQTAPQVTPTVPAAVMPLAAPPATAPPLGRMPQLGAPPPPPPPGGAARITLQPSTATAPLNSALTMTIYAENVMNLGDVSAQLQYDPKILRVSNIVTGDLPGRNLAPLDLSKNVLDDAGRADMHVSRGTTGGTISGSGSLFSIVFQAVGRGNTSVSLNSVGIANAIIPPPVAVTVQ